MDAYRGDLDRALRGFQNPRRLSRSPVASTNIAEIYVYRGNLAEARRWNDLGVRSGAPYRTPACGRLSIATEQRELSKEAALEELRIEMERVRRMRRVYDKDRTLDIQVE